MRLYKNRIGFSVKRPPKALKFKADKGGRLTVYYGKAGISATTLSFLRE